MCVLSCRAKESITVFCGCSDGGGDNDGGSGGGDDVDADVMVASVAKNARHYA